MCPRDDGQTGYRGRTRPPTPGTGYLLASLADLPVSGRRSPDRGEMNAANLSVEAAAVVVGAWVVVRGNPDLGLLRLGVGVYLHETNGGGRDRLLSGVRGRQIPSSFGFFVRATGRAPDAGGREPSVGRAP